MSSTAYVAREAIDGQDAAESALQDLRRTVASPDMLHERLQAVLLTREPERLRAFMRRIQKAAEQAFMR